MAILTSADYPSVRAALDVNLDATLLPDSVIALPIYHAAAEMAVRQVDPEAENRTGEDATRVRLAAIYLCAASLAPNIPKITAQTLGANAFQSRPADWADQARQLKAAAMTQLGLVTGTQRGAHFGRALGRRGVW